MQAPKDQFFESLKSALEIVFVMKALPAQVACNVGVSTSGLQQTDGTRHMGGTFYNGLPAISKVVQTKAGHCHIYKKAVALYEVQYI